MRTDRLDIIRNYAPETVQNFLKDRIVADIPADIQEYLLQLNSAISIIHHNGTNLHRACDRLMIEYPSLTRAQAKRIYYDTLEYFFVDDAVSARAWDMVYADQFEDLKNIAIKQDKLSVALKCMEKAHALRTTTRESLDYDWTPPVFLISTEVRPESLGYKSQKILDIARRNEDVEYKRMIDSLETTDAEKERLYAEAGIRDIDAVKVDEDEI